MHVAVIDIGSPKKTRTAPEGNLGWWIRGTAFELDGAGDHDIDRCISAVICALDHGPVALGFEAPMFVPKRDQPEKLTQARRGESSRAFSASAGATALTTALTIVPYVLTKLKKKREVTATMEWEPLPTEPNQLLFFEAFVTNQRSIGTDRHVRDAQAAVQTFFDEMPCLKSACDVEDDAERFNLLGAAMLLTGWSSDLCVLHKPCLVVKAGEPIRNATTAAARRTEQVRLRRQT